MKPIAQILKEKPWLGWVLFFATVIVVFFIGLLASSIVERRAEAVFAYKPEVKFGEFEPRHEVWTKYFPREGQSYALTSTSDFKSKYNGSAMIDMLDVDPRLVVLWAGYGFSKDYNQGRGHGNAIDDIHNTLRTGAPMDDKSGPQPNTCWACKSTDVPRVMNEEGVAKFYSGKWASKGHEIVNGIGCADCHDSKTMNLKITRPALIEAFQRQGKDITKVSHQEMRSLVCAQCHVEYYFNKKSHGEEIPYLTFPWDEGMTVEAMEGYYDSTKFSDWTHGLSKAPMLKAQHPDYEVYSMGIHAQRGVSCADCHMPYKSEGGQKFTDHHIQSPLNNISASCQVCHRQSEVELQRNVIERQDKIIEIRDQLEILLVKAHVEAKTAWDNGANEAQMKDILTYIRHAQWRWDYAAASHGASFHAPIEISRIIGTGIERAQDARILLARLLPQLGFKGEVSYPDISTKEKAQKYIGLDVEKLKQEKELFKKEILPKWRQKADERESKYQVNSR